MPINDKQKERMLSLNFAHFTSFNVESTVKFKRLHWDLTEAEVHSLNTSASLLTRSLLTEYKSNTIQAAYSLLPTKVANLLKWGPTTVYTKSTFYITIMFKTVT